MLVANYATKKKLKDSLGESLKYQETSIFSTEYKSDGVLTVVGPSANDRKWYAQVTMYRGKIIKVK